MTAASDVHLKTAAFSITIIHRLSSVKIFALGARKAYSRRNTVIHVAYKISDKADPTIVPADKWRSICLMLVSAKQFYETFGCLYTTNERVGLVTFLFYQVIKLKSKHRTYKRNRRISRRWCWLTIKYKTSLRYSLMAWPLLRNKKQR